MCIRDSLGKAWQIVLGKDGSTVLDVGSREATTVIETPWDLSLIHI